MNDALKLAIQEIVFNVPRGCIFDSHFVIDALIKAHSGDYESFNDPNRTTAQTHGLLAQQISICNVPVIRIEIDGVDCQSYSETIRGEPGKCACWRRL